MPTPGVFSVLPEVLMEAIRVLKAKLHTAASIACFEQVDTMVFGIRLE